MKEKIIYNHANVESYALQFLPRCKVVVQVV